MSAKTLLIATVALATTAATALPALAVGPNQAGPGPGQVQMNQPGQPGKTPLRWTIMFNLLDRNSDGSITKDELDVVRDAIFASVDTDSDGKLTKEEIQSVGPMFGPRGPGDRGGERMGRHQQRGEWQGRHDDRRGPPGRQGQLEDHRGPRADGMMGRMAFGGQGQGAGFGPQFFASLDTNGDGVISQEEFAAAKLPFPGLAQQ